MSGGQNETPCGWQADTGRGNRNANAAGTSNIAENSIKRHWLTRIWAAILAFAARAAL